MRRAINFRNVFVRRGFLTIGRGWCMRWGQAVWGRPAACPDLRNQALVDRVNVPGETDVTRLLAAARVDGAARLQLCADHRQSAVRDVAKKRPPSGGPMNGKSFWRGRFVGFVSGKANRAIWCGPAHWIGCSVLPDSLRVMVLARPFQAEEALL